MPYPLLTERLRIQPLAMGDIDTFVQYRQDPHIARFQSWDCSYSRDQAIELIQSQLGFVTPDLGDWLQLAIHLSISNAHIGDLAIHRVANQDGVFELGFTIATQYQRQGYAKEAVRALIEFLRAEAGATRAIATTDSRNISSIRLLESMNFMQDRTKSWTEEFKGEVVTVDYFEKDLSQD